jgi:hypothetical protein
MFFILYFVAFQKKFYNFHKNFFCTNFNTFQDVIVSIGPLALGDDVLTLFAEEQAREMEKEVIEEVFAESSNVSLPGYFIYALIGCVCTVVILLAAIIVLSYKRKQSQKVHISIFVKD